MKVKSFRIRDRNKTSGYGEIIELGAVSDNIEISGETTAEGSPKDLTTKIAEITSSINNKAQKKVSIAIDSSLWIPTSTSDSIYTYNYRATLKNSIYVEKTVLDNYEFINPKIDYTLRPFKFVFSTGQLIIYTRMPAAEAISMILYIENHT